MKKITCPITAGELRFLVEEEKLTDKQIASRFQGGTVHRIQRWRYAYGIDVIPRWSRNELLPIEGKLQSLLVGSMFGDGRLVRHPNSTYFSERHCGEQKSYLEWKAVMWGTWAKEIKLVPDKRGYSQFRMETHAHPILNPWQELFYANHNKGWKRLLPQVIDLVDEFALTIWYIDDGNAGWWPGITFGADSASRVIALSVFEKFGLKPRWQLLKGNTGHFHMEREDTAIRFLDIVTPHIPDCMSYKKGPFGFQGSHYQVRQKIQESKLREFAGQGIPIRRIGKMLGVGANTVNRYLIKWEIAHPRTIGQPRKFE